MVKTCFPKNVGGIDFLVIKEKRKINMQHFIILGVRGMASREKMGKRKGKKIIKNVIKSL